MNSLTYLWRHPVRCTDRCVFPGESRGQMRGHAEIDQFDTRFFSEQNVMTLHVTMHAVITMQKDQSFDGLPQDVSYLIIR